MTDDIHPESISTARAEAEKAGLTNVEFVVGDVEDLSRYQDNTFDIAHAHQVMIHLVHPVESLRHMHRIIKSRGVVGIRDLVFYRQVNTTALMNENLNRFWQDSMYRGARGPDAGSVNHIWMHEAGFAWEHIERGSVGFDHEKDELPAIGEGQMSFAKARGESEEYMGKLRREWEEWVANPEARGIASDGWVVGTKK